MTAVGARVRDVCFVHWPVDPGPVERRLPHELSAATRDGAAWVSVLGMRTSGLLGPVPTTPWFSQVTIRTYATVDGEPAVYFLRVDTDSRLAAVVGNRFGIAFRHADATVDAGGRGVTAESRGREGAPLLDASFEHRGSPEPVDPDSTVGWLTDRSAYALDDGRVGRVDHDTWRLAPADAEFLMNRLLASEGLPDPVGDPLVRYSPGADFRLSSWPERVGKETASERTDA